MSHASLYQVTCADCLTIYGGFKTKREAHEWLIEHGAVHAGETTEVGP